ncbi:MAG TPA: hypothetical protein VHY80_07280, partial [Stellaceae bacterium]|nr:hypothetical protein [Stellaceae bacterium]
NRVGKSRRGEKQGASQDSVKKFHSSILHPERDASLSVASMLVVTAKTAKQLLAIWRHAQAAPVKNFCRRESFHITGSSLEGR